MRFVRLFCIAALLAIGASAYAQTVWKWTDSKGIVHYSDQPGPNAVEVSVVAPQTLSSDQDAAPPSSSTRPATRPAATDAYRTLQIASPAAQETIQGTGGQVTVQLSLEPGLQSGHSIQLFMDGKQVSGPNSTSLSYSLPEVDRGEHSLRANVVNRDGETLISSPSVTFYIRVPTVPRPAR